MLSQDRTLAKVDRTLANSDDGIKRSTERLHKAQRTLTQAAQQSDETIGRQSKFAFILVGGGSISRC